MAKQPSGRARPERRKRQRVALARGIFARFGTIDVIIVDISEGGARVEHFTQFNVGKKALLRFEWQQETIETQASVVSCKVHRFAHEEKGTTVYQSGLFFTDQVEDTAVRIHEMVTMLVARSLAEQVANARGIGPVIERNMPVFRSGGVVANELEANQESAERLIPTSEVVIDRGYIRRTLIGGMRFDQKWSRTPDQPAEGFTVSAAEPSEHVEQLCENYLKGSEEDRKLILLLAQLSVEKA